MPTHRLSSGQVTQGNPNSSSETEKVRRGRKADVCPHCAGWKSRRACWGIPRITFSPEPDGREGAPTAVCRGVHLSLRGGSRGGGPQRPPPSRRLSHPSLGGTGSRLGELREVLWRTAKPWVVPAHHRQCDWSWHRTQPRKQMPVPGRCPGGTRGTAYVHSPLRRENPMTWKLSRLQCRNPKSSSGYKDRVVSLTRVTHL